MAKIAIIDDESDILNILERFLKRSGDFEIETFNNPISGLAAIQRGGYDLALLDIMMPQMDGLDVLREIKTTNSEVEVIMMTAFTTLERTMNAHKLGATQYLTKPFENLKEVEEKIRKVLNL